MIMACSAQGDDYPDITPKYFNHILLWRPLGSLFKLLWESMALIPLDLLQEFSNVRMSL
jgi:hypothetical protein